MNPPSPIPILQYANDNSQLQKENRTKFSDFCVLSFFYFIVYSSAISFAIVFIMLSQDLDSSDKRDTFQLEIWRLSSVETL